jgi:hypothetical protein
MNDLKFAFRQLLKNPAFSAGGVLNCAKGLLSSQHAADLAVLQPHVDDDIPAAAMDVVAGAVADAPANFARAGVLRGRDQASVDFNTFVARARIGRGHGASQRHRQFVFQDCFIQSLGHDVFPRK